MTAPISIEQRWARRVAPVLRRLPTEQRDAEITRLVRVLGPSTALRVLHSTDRACPHCGPMKGA